MNIIKKITAGTLALVLATGLAGSALAEDVTAETNALNTTTVQVIPMKQGGVLSVSIDNLDFSSHQYSLADRTVDGSLGITATDQRGTAMGWRVTLTGSDFDENFQIDNLSLLSPNVTKGFTPDFAHPTFANPAGLGIVSVANGETYTVLQAQPGTGAGVYDATYGASLNIPGGTLVGDYTTTLEVTILGDTP